MEINGTAGTHCWTWTLNNLLRLEQQERKTRRKDLQKSEHAEFVTVFQNWSDCLDLKSTKQGSSKFHDSRLITRIQQTKFTKKSDTWLGIEPDGHSNHYMFSVLMWDSNWILFTCGWFFPIRLIHQIRLKSLDFEKKVYLERLDLATLSVKLLMLPPPALGKLGVCKAQIICLCLL